MPSLSPSRRRFLQFSGASALALAMPRVTWSREEAAAALIVRQESPYNAEPPLEPLTKAWSTPTELMFVRSHGKKLPKLDAKAHRIKIEGMVDKPQELSLEQLARVGKAAKHHVTLTCAGNRRDEHSATKKVGGVQWSAGAIGNPEWEGVTLRDVLAAAGVKADAKHVWFEGADEVEHGDHTIAFGGSISLQKLATGELPVLLATKMNGAALTAEHGFPVRVVVPGFIGARSVKWLSKIVVNDRPSPNHFLQETYKVVEADTPEQMAKAEPIYENVLNAAICLPASGAKLKAGKNKIAGYALPSGDPNAKIAKVEVAVDGKWQAAKTENADSPFCWATWQKEIDLTPGKHVLMVRATDSRGVQQPETTKWNAKGYLYNGWHKVEVTVEA
jgi:sulfite oxidase